MDHAPALAAKPGGDLRLARRLIAENGRDYLGRYVIAALMMAVYAATTGASAWLMRDVVDGIFFAREERLIILVPLLMGGLFVLRGGANYVSTVLLAQIGNGIVARLQRRLFDKILALGTAFFDRTHSAELVTRMTHHALAVRDALEKIGNTIIRDLLTLMVLVAVMIWQSPLLSLAVFLIGPVAIFLVARLLRRIRHAADAEVRFVGQIGALLQETALGIRVVRAFTLEPVMRRKMETAIGEAEARANRVATQSARTAPIMESLAGLAVAGILLWTGYAVVNSDATPGAFVAFITAMLLAYEPAARLARFNAQLAGKMVGARMIYELLDEPAPAPTGGAPLAVPRGEIVFDRVAFRYRPEQRLFDALSFTAKAGETTALVGPSGAGKSTVIALIERFVEPAGGRILIDGTDIATVDVTSLRAQTALVSQDIRLFTGTVRDNIRYGRLDATDAEVEAAARDALADGFIRALPKGYDTEAGEQGAQLSGGQRQRIAIARALLRNARMVLLDEATSALDSDSEAKVQAAFDRLKAGRTTIVVAHRLSTVLAADKICVFSDGAVVEEGNHRALLAAGGVYARLYRLQFEPEARSQAAE
ncbi:MAG: ABC transporter ATP-binding protein [Bauldia sp.]|nr:ABC transporter ATP-binding protein [Bauldia sp.]